MDYDKRKEQVETTEIGIQIGNSICEKFTDPMQQNEVLMAVRKTVIENRERKTDELGKQFEYYRQSLSQL